MPFVEGESVRARLQREGALPIADAVRILREVADALAFAHSQGVVHRDIKPDNVLMSGKHALVADFGVAKAISEASGRTNVTTMGVALGTPAYMAPEQAAADPLLDHRVDVYALGVLAYELLVGEPPFVRRTPQQVIAAHLTEQPPSVLQRRPSTPPALDALIARCLAKQPSDRFQSAEDVVSELERLATPTGMAPTTGVTLPIAATGTRRHLVIGGVAVAALVALTAWALLRPRASSALDANAVVVLPFEFSASPELSYLREGVVNLLESSLTGEGGPRAVASQTTIARWKRAGGADHGLTEDEARAIARELGAGQLLRGSIVGTPANVILNATIVATDGNRPDVQATVNGPADSIASLGSRLAAQLLSLRVGEGAERLASLSSVPPAALRAYLQGQELFRTGRYSGALRSYEQALAADSTFALAALSHALATSWDIATSGTSPGAAIAFRHREKLGPRDLVLLEMWQPRLFDPSIITGRQRIERLEQLAARIPDRPEAWYLVGDAYFHSGAAYGFEVKEAARRAETAFRRALELDPNLEYMRRHVVDIGHFSDEPFERVPKVIDSLNLDSPDYALQSALMRGDSARVKQLRANFPNVDVNRLMLSSWIAASLGAPDLSDSAFALALARPITTVERRGLTRAWRALLLAGGRPVAAARATTDLERIAAQAGTDLFGIDLLLGAVFADGDTVAAARVAQRSKVTMHAPGASIQGRWNAAWATGLWASFRADSVQLAQSIAFLDSMAAARDSTSATEATQLRADVLRLAVPNAGSDRRILERADSVLSYGPLLVTGDSRAAMNIIVARNFERLGETRRALRAASRVGPGEVLYIMGTPAARDQIRLNLAAGDTALAIMISRSYLLGRRGAEPPQKKADEAIQKKLDELLRLRR